MRFCVNGRQPYSVIEKADEIKFNPEDHEKIFDLIENYSDKTIILADTYSKIYRPDWKTLQLYNEKFKEFYIALNALENYKDFEENGIKWFWSYPITSFYELRNILKLNPSYIEIGPPLSFDLEEVKAIAGSIPIRMTVNTALPPYLPVNKEANIIGQWVRPEDVKEYEPYIQCFDFQELYNLTEEESYLRTYQNGIWPGNLSLLIKKLNYPIDNRAIPEDFGKIRTTCGQRCCSGSMCHFCESALKFTSAIGKASADRKQKALIDNN